MRSQAQSKGEAQDYLNSIIGNVSNGTWQPDSGPTVRTLLPDHWLPAQVARGLRPATLAQYRHIVIAWIIPRVGGVKTAALTPKAISTMTEELRTSTSSTGRAGLSDRSVQLAVGTLKSATRWAHRNGLVTRDPLSGVDRPSSSSRAMTAWTVDEAREMLGHSSPTITISIYAHAMPGMAEEAGAAMSARLLGAR